jgi:predicted membrane protein
MSQTRIILGLLVIVFGISLLIDIPVFKFAFAAIIIWIGFSIITGRSGHQKFLTQSENAEDSINRVLIFSGLNQKVKSDNFQKAEVVAIFGGGELDLSKVKTKQTNVPLEFVAIFGGLKVILPPTWQVQSEGVGILGGFNNQAQSQGTKTKAIIKGVAIFGGVDITS